MKSNVNMKRKYVLDEKPLHRARCKCVTKWKEKKNCNIISYNVPCVYVVYYSSNNRVLTSKQNVYNNDVELRCRYWKKNTYLLHRRTKTNWHWLYYYHTSIVICTKFKRPWIGLKSTGTVHCSLEVNRSTIRFYKKKKITINWNIQW